MSDLAERLVKLDASKQALLQARLQKGRGRTEPVAIIGMGCRLPKAGSLDAFWQLLCAGLDAIIEVPPERWDADDLYDQDPSASGKMATRWGGFLEQLDEFDANFFGISAREAIHLDPRQRLLMEVTWEALEDAAIPAQSLARSRTAVFIAALTNDFEQLLYRHLDYVDAYVGPGSATSILANRLSYFFDLRGCSLVVDTACSGSLVAIHLACQSLRSGESPLAIVGGVSVNLLPNANVFFTKAGAISPDGRCKTFDADSNGIVRSEGAGVVLLKLLSQAQADGDAIYAVIRGSAVNQDGRSNGIMAPNRQAQEAVLREAYNQAGVSPSQVQYIEAHGTGTNLGDLIEVTALREILCAERPAGKPCSLGSLKTNLGHLEPAAGVAGLIKVALAMKHRLIPPSIHFQRPNPLIPFQDSLHVQQTLGPWPDETAPLLAGVSSFGFGGTNSHLVMEEAPPTDSGRAEIERPLHLLTLSASTEEALKELAGRFEQHLAMHPEQPLADICFTANAGRTHLAHRLTAVAESGTEMLKQLKAYSKARTVPGLNHTEAPNKRRAKTVFMFTGQGSQYFGMAAQLFETQPAFRRSLERCQQILEPYLARPLLDYLYADRLESSHLNETWLTQPILFAVEYALAQLWLSWGVQPDAVLGHSLGEYVAACVSGIFSLADALKVVAVRGQLMSALPLDGAMMAVRASESAVARLIGGRTDELAIAAYNGPNSFVLSGRKATLEGVVRELKEQGTYYRQLDVSHAFHSPLMKPVLQKFASLLESVKFSAPGIPLVSNVSGRFHEERQAGPAYWLQHICQPVQFAPSINFLWESGYRIFLEVGPKPVLCALVKQIIPAGGEAFLLPSLSPASERGSSDQGDWSEMLSSLAQLYLQGVKVNWKLFDDDYRRHKLRLPTYPFQRQRYWPEELSQPPQTVTGGKNLNPLCLHPLLDQCIVSPPSTSSIFQKRFTFDTNPALAQHRVKGRAILPGVGYLEMAMAAARHHLRRPVLRLSNVVLAAPISISPGDESIVYVSVEPREGRVDLLKFEITSLPHSLHATGEASAGEFDSAPASLDLKAIRDRCLRRLAASEVYRSMQRIGIEYDSYFQSIEWLQANDQEVLARLRLPVCARQDSGYLLHPALMDGALQALGALVLGATSEQNGRELYLPFSFDNVRVRGELPESLYSYGIKVTRTSSGKGPEEIIRADVKLANDRGQVLVELDGICLKRVAMPHGKGASPGVQSAKLETVLAAASSEDDVKNCFYQIQWQPSPLPARAVKPRESDGRWLVLLDELGVGASLAQMLRARGDLCVELQAAREFAERGDMRYSLNPKQNEDYGLLTQSLMNKSITPTGIIHLWTCSSSEHRLTSLEYLEHSQDKGAYSLLFLTQALAEQFKNPLRYCLVSSYSQALGESPERPIAPEKAPLWGFSKAILKEYPHLFISAIDLETDGWKVDDLATLILSEIESAQPSQHSWAAYLGGERLTAEMVRVDVERETATQPIALRNGGVYVITGGQSGIGLEIARHIAGQVQARLVLLNRTPLNKDSHPERIKGIRDLQTLGAEVMSAEGDVAEVEAMQKLFERIEKRWGRMDGIVHSAGVLRDGLLRNLNRERFNEVLRPKMLGSWVLDYAAQKYAPDFFLLCSSLSSLMPPLGQSNYAAANSFEDAFAYYRTRRRKQRTIAINWGPWGETGMAASPQLQEQLRAQGVRTLTNAEGRAGFAEVLKLGLTQAAFFHAGSFSQAKPLAAAVQPHADAGFETPQAKSLDPNSDLPAADLPSNRTETGNSEVLPWIRQTVITQLARSLNVSPDLIALDQSFTDLGLDSLLFVEIMGALEKEFKVSLSPTMFFEYPTTAELAEHLNRVYGPSLRKTNGH